MGYTSESIYRVYFPDSRRIETVRDLEFDEGYSHQEIGTTVEEEPLFSFPKLEPFTESTFNTPVREEEPPFNIAQVEGQGLELLKNTWANTCEGQEEILLSVLSTLRPEIFIDLDLLIPVDVGNMYLPRT